MKVKRIISLLLLASLLTSASACGSEAPEKDNGTDTTAEETTEKPEYESTAAAMNSLFSTQDGSGVCIP